jgi:hypothetical protein
VRVELEAEVPECAFYVVVDERFFIGAVALINSLRLCGHGEPIFVLDSGLRPEQRTILAPHVRLLDPPDAVGAVYLTPYGPLLQPAGVAVLLDADMIVLRSLSELVSVSHAGKIVAFEDDPPCADRFFPEWQALLGLRSVRQVPYVNAGQLFVPEELASRLFTAWTDAQGRIPSGATRYGGSRPDAPLYFADQDALAAVLGACFNDNDLHILDHRLAPHAPFPGVRLVDKQRLVCEYGDGVRPFILHHVLAKPWLAATPANPYSLLLSRLLLDDDVGIRLDPGQVPLRLRRGALATVARGEASLRARVRAGARRNLGRLHVRTRARSFARRLIA